MRLLHTGDLHLDSPFCSSNILSADARRGCQRAALGRIFDLAKNEKCDMILIAGDLFDGKYVTPETQKYVAELFASVEMPVVISPGNHDPYVDGSFYKGGVFSDNVYIFSSEELQCFEFPNLGARVFGYAFTSQSLKVSPLAGQTPMEKDGYTNILCAHADISAPISRYCPLTVGDICNFGIDYAALGHIHNRDTDDSCGSSVIRYCGFPEGRSFDELGDGGVFIVDIEDGKAPTLTRHTVSSIRYEVMEIDVSHIDDYAGVRERVKAEAESVQGDKTTHLRIRLVGTLDADISLESDSLAKELSTERVILEIKDMTIPTADISALKQDISIKGAFYNALYGGLIDDDPKVRERTALALQIGLSAIDGRRIAGGKDEI